MAKTLILDAQIVASGKVSRGSVLINDGRIYDIIPDGQQTPSADDVFDASGLLLFPGAIDAHVHFRDPGLTHKADMASESAAAVAGGVTTVMDMPNVKPQTTTVEELDTKLVRACTLMRTNFSAYIGATNDNLDQVLATDFRHVCGIKLFMGSSTGGMLVDSDDALRTLFRNAPALIAAHCEDESIIRKNSEAAKSAFGDETPWSQHPLIRSAEACLVSSSRAAQLAREAGARLHILHVTTAAELDLLDRGDNRLVTGEVCPAHLWFSDEDYDRLGSLIKCNPAVKSKADRGALRHAVAQGVISTIGTDHAPHTLAEKSGHTYWQTPSGMPMIEHSLPLMLRLADEGWWDYTTVAARMAEDVAELYHIADRGHIRVGQWADLALVKPQNHVVHGARYKCGWTPLEGLQLNHQVVRTYVSGQLAFADGFVFDRCGMLLDFLK